MAQLRVSHCVKQLLNAVDKKLESTDANKLAAVKALLEHVFDDLEVVWTEADGARRDILVNLPFTALKQLLQSEAVAVASEDTILFTISSSRHESVTRLLRQLPRQNVLAQPLKQQRAELVGVVRVPYLSCYAMASIVPGLDWLTESLSMKQLLFAPLMKGRAAVWKAINEDLSIPEVWKQGPRRVSPMQSATFHYMVDVKDLEEAGKKAAVGANGEHVATVELMPEHPGRAFAGRSWVCYWWFSTQEEVVYSVVGVLPSYPSLDLNTILWEPSFTLRCGGCERECKTKEQELMRTLPAAESIVDPMPGGWDCEIWEAAGLPTSGKFTVNISVDLHE